MQCAKSDLGVPEQSDYFGGQIVPPPGGRLFGIQKIFDFVRPVGLLKPLDIKGEFRAKYLPMSWDAVTHKRQVWGYPVALEAASLIYNKKLVTGKVPTQLSELHAFGKELKAQHPHAIVIM
jgi:hypothetical protein